MTEYRVTQATQGAGAGARFTRALGLGAWALGLAALCSGCTDLLPEDDNCLTTNVCAVGTANPPPNGGAGSGGPAPAGDWTCLANPQAPTAPQNPAAPVVIDVAILGYRNPQPIIPSAQAPVTVKVCNNMDTACAAPLAAATNPPTPNGLPAPVLVPSTPEQPTFPGTPFAGLGFPAWRVYLPPPALGTLGFILVSIPGYLDYTSAFDPTLPAGPYPIPFQVLEEGAVNAFADGLGVSPVDARENGVLALRVNDCAGRPATGVTLELSPADPRAVPWAANARFPVANAPTDVDGVAGFVVVSQGNRRVTARLSNGQTFGSQAFAVLNRRVTTGVIQP
jgi:hypothetical protein